MTRILAIDLGKFKSVACLYDAESAQAVFQTLQTTPQTVHDLLVELEPDRLVIEVCGIAGWIHDMATDLDIRIEVANPQHEGWRWNKVKRKTDRDDALKLARLAAMNQLPTVYMPERRTRQWKSAIAYRHALVDRRTAIKNTIRALLDTQGLRMPSGASGWTSVSLERLRGLARPIGRCGPDDLWRGQLQSELTSLRQINELLQKIEQRLNRLAAGDERVQRLQSIPGVGTRLAELVVATIDRADRFRTGREVSAYAGLVPRQFESGTMSHRVGSASRGRHCCGVCSCRSPGAWSGAVRTSLPCSLESPAGRRPGEKKRRSRSHERYWCGAGRCCATAHHGGNPRSPRHSKPILTSGDLLTVKDRG